MAASHRALIVGCGYVGKRLAQRLMEDAGGACEVFALVRTEASRAALAESGIAARAIDLDQPLSGLPFNDSIIEGSSLFYLTPPAPRGESDSRLDRFLRALRVPPKCFLYMSTTGVYGNTNGEEVDETTPVNPQTERAQRRMSAEHMTRIWCVEHGSRRIVLRVPGIYGPGRLAVARLRNGEPFVRLDEAGVTNRIHVHDLVEICIAAAADTEARGVYNATDGNSISTTEFMRRVASIAGLPAPVEISMEEARVTLSAQRLSFLDESRRIGNRRLRELNVSLRYADVDAGIRASLADTAPSTTAGESRTQS